MTVKTARLPIPRQALLTLALLVGCIPAATSQETVVIGEPATLTVSELFKQADIVAVIRILSGDSEHYPITVYKAKVLTPFKGAQRGERLYFGPFVSYGVGSEYLAFLQRSKSGVAPSAGTADSGLHFGSVGAFYRVMYEGYSVMPIRYVCVFGGGEPKEPCDYAVEINTYQVKLPKSLRTTPAETEDMSSGDKKWVKREGLLSVLETFRNRK
jgi:hypothetical protein